MNSVDHFSDLRPRVEEAEAEADNDEEKIEDEPDTFFIILALAPILIPFIARAFGRYCKVTEYYTLITDSQLIKSL